MAEGLSDEEVERIELRAERLLEAIPEWLWDRESLPVPIEDIVDSHSRLLVRDVERMEDAPNLSLIHI